MKWAGLKQKDNSNALTFICFDNISVMSPAFVVHVAEHIHIKSNIKTKCNTMGRAPSHLQKGYGVGGVAIRGRTSKETTLILGIVDKCQATWLTQQKFIQ